SQNNDIPEITVSVVDVSDSVVENLNNKVGRAVTCDNVPNDNTNNKSSENKEKKLQAQDLNLVTQPCNSATSEASATNIPESSHSDSNEIISQDETGKIRKKTGGVTGVTGQSQNNDIPEITVSVVDVSDSVVENLNNKVGRAVTCDNVPNDNTNNKSSENKEKKLQAQDLNLVTQPCNSATSEASATNIPESSHSDSNEIISQDETGKIRKKTGVEHKKEFSSMEL
ncbi:11068_t:CDS:2, partial [Entrophospora sp. SA101]